MCITCSIESNAPSNDEVPFALIEDSNYNIIYIKSKKRQISCILQLNNTTRCNSLCQKAKCLYHFKVSIDGPYNVKLAHIGLETSLCIFYRYKLSFLHPVLFQTLQIAVNINERKKERVITASDDYSQGLTF
jgi:hypothetical protein